MIFTHRTSIRAKELQRQEMVLGVTKYLRKHRVKLQGQVSYNQATNLSLNNNGNGKWGALFQIEMGI